MSLVPSVGRRRGPRTGNVDTRDAVLSAAREEFASLGYDGATIRRIAARADVDPSLVSHYFGSKAELFRSALEFPIDPDVILAEVTAGDLDGAAERLLRVLMTFWEDPKSRRPMLAVIRTATTSEMGATMLREFLTRAVIGRVATRLAPDHAQLRISLAGSQLAGLVLARYVVKLPALANAPAETVILAVAPNLQRYLTGDLELP